MSLSFAWIASPNDGLISRYALDDGSGAVTLVSRTEAGSRVGPMALSPDGRTLYAALRAAPCRVAAYAIDPVSGALSLLGDAPLAAGLSYLATDRAGTLLMGASYGGNVLTLQQIGPEHRVPDRGETLPAGPMPHSIRDDPSGRFVYACLLGADRVLQFRRDGDALTPIGSGFVATPEGTGPRHLAFSPDGRFLFIVGETSGAVIAYAIDARSGALTEVAQAGGIPTEPGLAPGLPRTAANNDLRDDPTPRIWAADIRLSPDGTLLFISERTTGTLSAFAVDPASGGLAFLGNHPVAEKQPRNFSFFPGGKYLLVCGEKSREAGSYAVGAEGTLTRVGSAPAGDGALWIETR